jgi:hypothetical protein
MKNLVIAPLALVFVALALSGCIFPGGFHHDRYGGGYNHPEGPYAGGGGMYQHSDGGYHERP